MRFSGMTWKSQKFTQIPCNSVQLRATPCKPRKPHEKDQKHKNAPGEIRFSYQLHLKSPLFLIKTLKKIKFPGCVFTKIMFFVYFLAFFVFQSFGLGQASHFLPKPGYSLKSQKSYDFITIPKHFTKFIGILEISLNLLKFLRIWWKKKPFQQFPDIFHEIPSTSPKF